MKSELVRYPVTYVRLPCDPLVHLERGFTRHEHAANTMCGQFYMHDTKGADRFRLVVEVVEGPVTCETCAGHELRAIGAVYHEDLP